MNEPASHRDEIDINGDLIPYADLPNYARRLVASRDEALRRAKELHLALTELKAEAEPEPTPEPWALIPEGRENAAVLRVNGVVGEFWRERGDVCVEEFWACREAQVTSVEPVQVVPEGARVLGEDEVAVPRELVERAREWAGPIMESAVPRTEVTGIVRDLAAVEGGEGR